MVTSILAFLKVSGPIFDAFMLRYWKLLLVLALFGGAYWYVNNLKSIIVDQGQQISTLQIENRIVKDNNIKLEAAISTTNEAIGKLADGSSKTTAAFSNIKNIVSNQSADFDKKLQQIVSGQKPHTCNDTIKYLIDAIPEYKK